jgi:hypothetical protein
MISAELRRRMALESPVGGQGLQQSEQVLNAVIAHKRYFPATSTEEQDVFRSSPRVLLTDIDGHQLGLSKISLIET